MHITSAVFLKTPRCTKCNHLTKLCNSSRNVFEIILYCDFCETIFSYKTGTEIRDENVTIGKANYVT